MGRTEPTLRIPKRRPQVRRPLYESTLYLVKTKQSAGQWSAIATSAAQTLPTYLT